MTRRTFWRVIACAAAAVGAAGCSSGGETADTSSDSVPPTTTLDASTTSGSAPSASSLTEESTSSTESSTSAPSTAPGNPDGDPTSDPSTDLRADGLGSYRFGDTEAAVTSGLAAQMGQPTSTDRFDLSVSAGGGFETVDSEYGFVQPLAVVYCYQAGLCVTFGGGAPGSLTLTGWSYAATTSPLWSTGAGVTFGSRWSEFLDRITADPGGCYSIGSGATDGVALTLSSSGVPFSLYDENGQYIAQVPPAAEVTVVDLVAGERVQFLLGDC